MKQENRKRIALLLIIALFLAPVVVAYVLNENGWRPAGTRNYGTLIEPPQDLGTAHFTLFALTGPNCAEKCLARIDELRRARLTLNQNAYRVRVVVLDEALDPARLAALKPVALARDTDARLAGLRPAGADEVTVALADPHGFLVLRYGAGYDGNLLRKDLARLVKG
jgi:hypothetical protein